MHLWGPNQTLCLRPTLNPGDAVGVEDDGAEEDTAEEDGAEEDTAEAGAVMAEGDGVTDMEEVSSGNELFREI